MYSQSINVHFFMSIIGRILYISMFKQEEWKEISDGSEDNINFWYLKNLVYGNVSKHWIFYHLLFSTHFNIEATCCATYLGIWITKIVVTKIRKYQKEPLPKKKIIVFLWDIAFNFGLQVNC